MSEEQKLSQDEYQSALFSQLVIMLATSAMQQLGKLVNPVTGKTELHMDGAQATIDLLDMLRAKTQGNLNETEEKLLKDTLHSLHMNYLETSQSAQEQTEPAPEKPAEAEAAPAAEEAAPAEAAPEEPVAKEPKADAPDSKEPKFHKKYD